MGGVRDAYGGADKRILDFLAIRFCGVVPLNRVAGGGALGWRRGRGGAWLCCLVAAGRRVRPVLEE